MYTDPDDACWLYFPGKMADLQKQHAGKQIWGYWLNATKEKLMYELLMSKNKVSINTISVITKDNNTTGFMFSRKAMFLKSKSKLKLPQSFHDSIDDCLRKHGFM